MGLSVDILLLFLIYDQSYIIDSAKLDFHSVISTFCINNGFKYVTYINNKCKNSSSIMKINSIGVRGELVKVARWKKLLCINSHHAGNLNFIFLSLCVYCFEKCPSQFLSHWEVAEPVFCSEDLSCLQKKI